MVGGAAGNERPWRALPVVALTACEREVLEGLARGLPNETIAYDLGISARTMGTAPTS